MKWLKFLQLLKSKIAYLLDKKEIDKLLHLTFEELPFLKEEVGNHDEFIKKINGILNKMKRIKFARYPLSVQRELRKQFEKWVNHVNQSYRRYGICLAYSYSKFFEYSWKSYQDSYFRYSPFTCCRAILLHAESFMSSVDLEYMTPKQIGDKLKGYYEEWKCAYMAGDNSKGIDWSIFEPHKDKLKKDLIVFIKKHEDRLWDLNVLRDIESELDENLTLQSGETPSQDPWECIQYPQFKKCYERLRYADNFLNSETIHYKTSAEISFSLFYTLKCLWKDFKDISVYIGNEEVSAEAQKDLGKNIIFFMDKHGELLLQLGFLTKLDAANIVEITEERFKDISVDIGNEEVPAEAQKDLGKGFGFVIDEYRDLFLQLGLLTKLDAANILAIKEREECFTSVDTQVQR